MHVAIHQAGQDQHARVVDHLGGRRRRTLADRRDHLTPDRHVAIRQHRIGQHEVAADDAVEGQGGHGGLRRGMVARP